MVFKNQARGTEDKRKKEFVNVSVLCIGGRAVYIEALLTTGFLDRIFFDQISINDLWSDNLPHPLIF